MLLFTIVTIQYLTVFNRISGQRLVLGISNYITPCSRHLRSERDSYLISARLGDNVTHLLAMGWQHFVTVQSPTSKPDVFQDICQIVINTTRCGSRVVSECYCHHRLITQRDTVMSVSVPAKTHHGNGLVRGEWRHQNGTIIYSEVQSSARIFDVTTAVLNLTVIVANTSTTREVTQACVLNVMAGLDNTLIVCCYNTAFPCYPYIHLGRSILSNNRSTCSNYNFTPRDGVTITASLLYSVCDRTEYIAKGNCTLKTAQNESGTIYFIPVGFFIVTGCLVSCWLLVVIVYVNSKIVKPRKQKRTGSTAPTEHRDSDASDGFGDARESVINLDKITSEMLADSIQETLEVNAVQGHNSEENLRDIHDIQESTIETDSKTITL